MTGHIVGERLVGDMSFLLLTIPTK